MCTAIRFASGDVYFGRNLDLERGYGEKVVITPRNYKFKMRETGTFRTKYGIIGMAAVVDDYPLYFEGTNEKGLSMAGLNFPGNAYYGDQMAGKDNVAPFELIPWVLGQCADVDKAKELLEKLHLVDVDFNKDMPSTPLHWMISDKRSSVVVESLAMELKVWENPFDVLTNNPTFDYHRMNMSNYMGLKVGRAQMEFRNGLPMDNYSFGMGALGLPGDYSSVSRFVRACFVKENSCVMEDEERSVNQFFHILDSVAMPKGCVWTERGDEYTRYSSCCNVNRGIYYYKTYENYEIRSFEMRQPDLVGEKLKMVEIAM